MQNRNGPAPLELDRWRNVAQIAAIAAMVVFAAGILIPSLGFARNLYLRNRCQTQLAQIYDGLSNYITDHDGRLPAVATADGSPWWKVGYQGRENHSNTRPVWLLVKQGYVDPARFLCPGTGQRPEPASLVLADYNDFPNKRHVQYSFRICCDKVSRDLRGARSSWPIRTRCPRDCLPTSLRLSGPA